MKQEQRVNVVVNVGEDKLKRKKRKKRKKTGAGGGGGGGAGVARQQPIVLHMPPQAQPFVPSYQPVQGFTPQNVPQEVAPITSTLTEKNVARMEAEQGAEFGTAQQYREKINIGSKIDDDLSVSDITDPSVRDADPRDDMLHQFTKDFGRQLSIAKEAQRRAGFDDKSIGQSSHGAVTFVEPPVQDLSVAESEPPRTIGRRRGRPAGRKDNVPRIRRTKEEVSRGMGMRSRSIS
jgi:hypothetical protein